MTKGNFKDTKRGSFHYHVLGDAGSRIHFCHGNSLSAGTYFPFLKKIAEKDFKIFAPDIRGHGLSTKERTQNVEGWELFVKDLEHLLTSITATPVIGMGHSIGAYFTYAAAAMFPHLFSRLVLLDPIIFPPYFVWMAAMVRKLGLAHHVPLSKMTRTKKYRFGSKEEAFDHYSGKGMFKNWKTEFLEAYIETAVEQDTVDSVALCCRPEFESQIYQHVPFNTWQHAKQIDIPTLVIRGETSDLFYRKSGNLLKKQMKDCTFIELKSLGHFLMMEDPDQILNTIQPFIQEEQKA